MNLPHITAPSYALQALLNLIVQIWSRFFGDRMDPVALPAELADLRVEAGTRKYVSALRCNFVYDPTSALVADGITVITSTIAGRWLREEPTSEAWGSQAVWYVHPTLGSDLASGVDQNHALQTIAEWGRRTGSGRWTIVDSTLNLLSDIPDTDPLPERGIGAGSSSLRIVGTLTPVDTGEIGAVVAANPVANAQPLDRITSVAGGWADHVGRLVQIQETGAWFRVAKDLGGDACLITRAIAYVSQDFPSTVLHTPVIGQHYTVYTESRVHVPQSGLRSTYGVLSVQSSGYSVVFRDLDFYSLATTIMHFQMNSSRAQIIRCRFSRNMIIDGDCKMFNTYTAVGGSLEGSNFLFVEAHLDRTGMQKDGGGLLRVDKGGLVLMNQGITLYEGITWCYGPIVGMDSPYSAVAVRQAATVVFSNGFGGTLASISGTNNTDYGLYIEPGGRVTRVNQGTLSIAGNVGDLLVGGSTSLLANLSTHTHVADGDPPTLDPCTTWAQLAAPPFSGRAFNCLNGAYIGL